MKTRLPLLLVLLLTAAPAALPLPPPQAPAAEPAPASAEEQRIRELMRDPAKRAAFMREHFPEPVFDRTPPPLPAGLKSGGVLIYSKTNGFRDSPAINAANAALTAIAQRRNWPFQTENGAVMNTAQLRRFKLVIWNNTSGDTLTEEQKAAFREWVEQTGGSFVGLHGAGGDPDPNSKSTRGFGANPAARAMFAGPRSVASWRWYVDTLLGAQFIGHSPIVPATVRLAENAAGASQIVRGLPQSWTQTDEWYAFEENPRQKPGFHILVTVDEKSYTPGLFSMGADHPLVWWHCAGKGHALYSALGHSASTYSEAPMVRLLENAMEWGLRINGKRCPA